jgi:hypothetical protein
MRNVIIAAAILSIVGALMIVGSYVWNRNMSDGVVWSKDQAEERVKSLRKLHHEITSMEQAQSRSQSVDADIQKRLSEARTRNAAARDALRHARRIRSAGTHALRTGGCLLILASGLAFLFVYESRNG